MIHGKGTPLEFTDTLEYADGTPVQVIRFTHKMDVLSSAIYNGGRLHTDCILIMQVAKDYESDDPHHDVQEIVDILKLPKETVGLMTAAEVEYVFNVTHAEYEGHEAYATVLIVPAWNFGGPLSPYSLSARPNEILCLDSQSKSGSPAMTWLLSPAVTAA